MLYQTNYDLWDASIEAWKDSAEVIGFLEHEICGLRAANGDPLPDAAKEFFLDLLFQRVKPRKGKWRPKVLIRKMYGQLLALEKMTRIIDPDSHVQGVSPSDAVKSALAEQLKTSTATVDQIVSPRKSRQPRKPRKS
jgi:hypothetical protein